MSTIKLLTVDIETRPHLGYSFGIWQQNLAQEKLVEVVSTISVAWKWAHEDRTNVADVNVDGRAEMLCQIWQALNEADAVITYNGDKFDLRHLNREFMELGLPPTPRIPSIDLFKVVKQNFDLPFYRLDYVAELFLGEVKLETGGFSLWKEYMAQNPKATKLMRKYNKQDVRLTEKLYAVLRPWIRNHPYLAAVPAGTTFDHPEYPCGTCGERALVDTFRPRRTRHYAIQQLICGHCSSTMDGQRKKLT